MTTTTTIPLSSQFVRLPSETANQTTESKPVAEFSVSQLRSASADKQPLQTAQDKITLILATQGEIKQRESSLAKNISTGNLVDIKADTALQDLRNDRKINVNSLSRELWGLSATTQPLAETSRLALQQELQALPQTHISADEGKKGGEMIPDNELWGLIAKTIGDINDNYLGVYEGVVALYTEFYQAFSKILSQMGGWITAGSDSNTVNFNSAALKAALQQLVADFEGRPLFSGTPQEALAWATELGLPESCVQGGNVMIDMTPILNMINNLPPSGKINNAAFQAWQSGFKAQEENLKNTLQTLTQKYSNANSLFDNLVKVLSSTISSCTETCKSFLQG
ncbi:type III secretion system needle tip protein SctA [Plesiomonas sp.]|uniref:type III secretion system needle tip protein SctA n=1 Tax=Plesiomonas sp. TaxID=2486279 RepID=UPI003F3DFBAB